MLILLTNDDGIHAPGLVAMYRELTRLGEVHVVAPETVQSATGHGITLSTPLLTSQVTYRGCFHRDSGGGRPADCVKLAVAKLLPRRPDLVVSGINSGANVGINVIYSGTVAAAIEAAFLGLPSIALSLYLRAEVPPDYARTAMLSRQIIEQIAGGGSAWRAVRHGEFPAVAGRADADRRAGGSAMHAGVGRHLRSAVGPARPSVLLEQQRLHAWGHRRRHRRRGPTGWIYDGDAVAVRSDAVRDDAGMEGSGVEGD